MNFIVLVQRGAGMGRTYESAPLSKHKVSVPVKTVTLTTYNKEYLKVINCSYNIPPQK